MIKPFVTCLVFFISASISGQVFQEVASTVGITHNVSGLNYGSGISFYDFNGDGWDDLTLGTESGDSIHFYVNNNGTFQKLIPSLVNHTEDAKQVLWADYDNDGDNDLFVATYKGTSRLYNNTGNLQMVDVTSTAGLTMMFHDSFGAAWGDINNDGWLDLYINNWNNLSENNILYLNAGNGTFIDITVAANAADSLRFSFCNAFFDFDKDGYQDIYIANDKLSRNTLLRNNGDATFTDVSVASKSDLRIDAMSVAVGDFNNTGYSDIYVSNGPGGNRLLRNNANHTFSSAAGALGVTLNGDCWGANFFDYDNDSYLDIYVSSTYVGTTTGQNTLFKSNDALSFSVPVAGLDGDTVESYSNAIGDFNNDGFPDFVTSNATPYNTQLWENGGNTNNWIKVELEGRVSNRNGIGSWIEVYTPTGILHRYTHCGIGFLAQNSGTEIIGLDTNTRIDSIVVRWLSGHVDRLYNIAVNQKLYIIEGSTLDFFPQLQASTTTVCEGDSVLLFLSKNYTAYNWSTGQTSKTIKVAPPGSYFVNVKNIYGFERSSDTLHLDVFPNTLDLKVHSVPVTSGTDANGMAIAEVSGGKPPYQYAWNDLNKQTTDTAFGLYPGTFKVEIKDQDKCKINGQVTIKSVVGRTYPNTTQKKTRIYPSPANDELHIELPSNQVSTVNWNLTLTDITGKKIKSITLPGSTHHYLLNLRMLAEGTYLLHIQGDQIQEVTKVTVNRP